MIDMTDVRLDEDDDEDRWVFYLFIVNFNR